MSLYLRPRTVDDCTIVVGWVPSADALYLFTGPRLRWPLTSTQLSAMERTGLTAWMLADEVTNTVVGHFDLTIDGDVARIGRVIIDPTQRGRGLARILMDFAVDRARLAGASEAQLNVIASNEPAIRTYLRVGFVEEPNADRPDVRKMSLTLR